jgi:hypothetical protein
MIDLLFCFFRRQRECELMENNRLHIGLIWLPKENRNDSHRTKEETLHAGINDTREAKKLINVMFLS